MFIDARASFNLNRAPQTGETKCANSANPFLILIGCLATLLLLRNHLVVSPTQSLHRMQDSFNYVYRTQHPIADRSWRSIPTDHLGFILFHLLLKDDQIHQWNFTTTFCRPSREIMMQTQECYKPKLAELLQLPWRRVYATK